MSRHEIPVIKIDEIYPHPNANALGIVNIYGWTCCVKLDQFKPGDLAIYIPPDYVCNTDRPEFAFLSNGKSNASRIKVKKLRGVISQGLVINLDPSLGLKEGDNAMEALGIIRYEPPEDFSTGGDNVNSPSGLYCPKYDVETFNRYLNLFNDGEQIIATEKIHGCNGRFVFSSKEDTMYCGSRTNWKANEERNVWWKALARNPWIERWCRKHPDILLYGEVFGQVQSLKYGAGPNDFFFAAFDILDHNNWVPYDVAQEMTKDEPDFKWVPLVYRGPFNKDMLLAEAEGNSLWPKAENQIREGLVIKPVVERIDPTLGRVQLKMVSNRYLEKSNE